MEEMNKTVKDLSQEVRYPLPIFQVGASRMQVRNRRVYQNISLQH